MKYENFQVYKSLKFILIKFILKMASFSLADPEIQFVVAFVFINFITFLILLFFNSPVPYNFGIFKNQVADVSKEFEVRDKRNISFLKKYLKFIFLICLRLI